MVRVVLSDGREFTGDLVVGADGVHSKMRELMWDMANAKVPGMITVDEKRGKYLFDRATDLVPTS